MPARSISCCAHSGASPVTIELRQRPGRSGPFPRRHSAAARLRSRTIPASAAFAASPLGQSENPSRPSASFGAWMPISRTTSPLSSSTVSPSTTSRTTPFGPSRSPSQAGTPAMDINDRATAPKIAGRARKSGPTRTDPDSAGNCGENLIAHGTLVELLRHRHKRCRRSPPHVRRTCGQRRPAALLPDPV